MVSDDRTGWESTFKNGLDACSRYEYSKAQRFFSKALEEAHGENAVDHSIGEIFFNLGWCHQALHEYQAAEQRYKQALSTMERCHGRNSEAADRVANQIVELYRISNRSEQADIFMQSRGQVVPSAVPPGGITDQAAADLNALLSSGVSRAPFPNNSIAPGNALTSTPSKPFPTPGAVPSAYPQNQSSPPPAPSLKPGNSLTNMLTNASRDQSLLPKSAPPPPSPRSSSNIPAVETSSPQRVSSGTYPASAPPPPPPPPGASSFEPLETAPPQVAPNDVPADGQSPRVLSGDFPAAEPPPSSLDWSNSFPGTGASEPKDPFSSQALPSNSPASGLKKSDNGGQQQGAPTAVKVNRGPENSYQSAFVAGSMFSGSSAVNSPAPATAPALSTANSAANQAGDAPESSGGEVQQLQQGRRVRNRFLATATGAEDPSYDALLAGVNATHGSFDIERFVHPKEKIYRRLSIAIGCIVYFYLVISLLAVVVAPLAALAAFIAHGIALGGLRGSGIRVSNRQFPEVQQLLEEYCTMLRVEIPEVLIVHHEGILNAWAQRLHRKNLVIISADVLELAYEQGDKELAFVIVHELAHVKLGHTKWGWLHLPAAFVPFLGSAYSRACEYSCDRIARRLVPDGALFGLVALAAGKRLYRNVNLKALYEQAEEDWGFWTWFHEIRSSHPNLLNRIRAIGIADEAARRYLVALLIVGAASLLLSSPSSAQLPRNQAVVYQPVSQQYGEKLLIAEGEAADSDGQYAEEGSSSESEESASSSEESSDETATENGDNSVQDDQSAQGESAGSEPVSLAHIFMTALGMAILIVVALSIPIGFSAFLCAIIWKIGMVMRGGRKPDIG